jgi:hypothetical protein
MYDKHHTTPPTVSTDALMISLMIDAFEKRNVATANVYLHADMDDFVLLKLTGNTVDIMCQANEKYKAFVNIENNKKVLYLQLMKAFYGCVRSALLWYELFSPALQPMGFVLNPYDQCVANKTINGKQCTTLCYLDDTKISQEDPKVVTAIIEAIEAKFDKMAVRRGREHVFSRGMKIMSLSNQPVRINMRDYIHEAIVAFGEDVSLRATTPAKSNLFDVKSENTRLPTSQSDLFHSIVTKLSYVAKRGRPDIMLAIAFLCTRVSCSDCDDWFKLKRLLQY